MLDIHIFLNFLLLNGPSQYITFELCNLSVKHFKKKSYSHGKVIP